MSEESHRDAMNAAIRAQRERANVPKSMLPPEDEPTPILAPEPMTPEPATPEPEPTPKRGLLSRLLGR